MFPRLGLASLLACCWSLPSSGLFWESLGTVLCYFGGENAVRFLVLFFFGVLPLRFFGFFVVLHLSGSVFGRLLCNRIFQPCWLTIGDLGYRNLLVLHGEMLPFFFWILLLASVISLFNLEMVCLRTSVGVTPQQLTRLNSSAAGGCFPLPCPMKS